MVDQASGFVGLIKEVETLCKTLRERKDIAEDNVDYLLDLKRLYNALSESMQHLLSMKSFMNAAIQPLVDDHFKTVQKNLRSIDALEREGTSQRVTNRVRRRRGLLDGLKSDANVISDFVRAEVANVLPSTATNVGGEHYIPDNNVEGNPPRLSLNYNSTSTSEGKLKSAVLDDNGSKVIAIVARGLGGVGKTCALRGLALDADIRKRFTGGTLYIKLGNDARVSTVVQGIVTIVKRTGGTSLAAKVAGAKTIQDAVDEASMWFRLHTCLFLIDDIWWVNGIDSGVLKVLATMVNDRSRVVCTTRDGKFLNNSDMHIDFTTKETHGDSAREILLTHGGFDWKERLSDKNEEAVRGILDACQGLPVALGVAGETVYRESQLRQGPSEDTWSDVNNVIKNTLIDQDVAQYGSMRLIADTSLTILDSQHKDERFERMFRALCVVEKQQMVPTAMLRNLWGLDDLRNTMDVVNQFHDVCIMRKVVFGSGRVFVQLHDLILEIALRKASEKGEVEDMFRKLVANYAAENIGSSQVPETRSSTQDVTTRVKERGGNGLLHWLRRTCCLGNGKIGVTSDKSRTEIAGGAMETDRLGVEWWRCDDGEYLHDNLCRILREAGCGQEVLWLLSRPEWIVRRAQNRGIFGVEQDIEVGKRVARSEGVEGEGLVKHLDMVRRAARMGSAQVHKNKREAWFQIHGRLLWYATQCERTRQFVEDMEACAPKPWARASMGFLEQAGSAALQTMAVGGAVYSVRMDHERLACCWILGTTVGVTRCDLASGAIERQTQNCDEIEISFFQKLVSLSRDMKNVVIGLKYGVWIWNTETEETKQIGQHREDVLTCVDIRDDGRRIASGYSDGTVRLWDASSGERVGHLLDGHESDVFCVAWSPDGRHVVSGGEDNAVRLWDVESGAGIHQPLLGHEGIVTCVAWRADGSRIVSGSLDETVRVWDAVSGESVGGPLVGHTEYVSCVEWSADHRFAVSGSRDGTLRLWDIAKLRLWDIRGGAGAAEVLNVHLEPVNCVAWSSCGTRVASGSWDSHVRVWEVNDGTVQQDDRNLSEVGCFALNGNRSRVLTGSGDSMLRMWDVGSGKAVGQPFVGHTAAVNCVAWSMDETRAASVADDGTVCVWDIESQALVGQPLFSPEPYVMCVAWSRDGNYVASGTFDGTVRLWDVENRRLLKGPLEGHTDGVWSLAWRWDGTRVASGSSDRTVRVWDVSSGTEVRQSLIGHSGDVDCVSWSLDGGRIASGSRDCTVRVWSVVSEELVGPPLKHNRAVKEVGLSEDGSQVVSTEQDGLQRIWRVADGECVATSNDEQWDEAIDKLVEQRISTGRRGFWVPPSLVVAQVQADGSEVILGTCDDEVERIGDLWFSWATFAHCRVMQ